MKNKRKFIPIPKDIGDYIAYSEESSTGLVWKVDRGKFRAGQEAGTLIRAGYFQVRFKYCHYKSHRVAYFLNTGVDPERSQIDHIDGDKSNNKIWNLRLATHQQNQDNKNKQKNNTTGVTGVSWCKTSKKHYAHICCSKNINLGVFNKSDKDKAIAVRIVAETDPRFRDQEFRNPHNDEHAPSPEMLVWAKQYLEDRIERLNWKEKYNLQ